MIFFKQANLFIFLMLLSSPFAAADAVENETGPMEETLEGARHYFPDDVGLEWTYSGSIADQVQRVATYTNVARVTGTAERKGERVVVFSESNPADQGASESYFKKDKKGITYFGGKPTTDFERQMTPYQVIAFPIVLQKPHRQIEKAGLLYDLDMDGDGINEQADLHAAIIAVGFETVMTPAGTFRNTIKLQGKMTIGITLSRNQKKVEILDTTTHWFALGVGMVQGIEKIELPAMAGKAPSGMIITEVLEKFSTKGPPT